MPELADGANPRQGIEKERCQKLYLYLVYTENRLPAHCTWKWLSNGQLTILQFSSGQIRNPESQFGIFILAPQAPGR